jgi:hypothetical protein
MDEDLRPDSQADCDATESETDEEPLELGLPAGRVDDEERDPGDDRTEERSAGDAGRAALHRLAIYIFGHCSSS